jgi:hypothetical protein
MNDEQLQRLHAAQNRHRVVSAAQRLQRIVTTRSRWIWGVIRDEGAEGDEAAVYALRQASKDLDELANALSHREAAE